MGKRKFVGRIECRICTVRFQAIIHHLSEPIDVYSEWIDECQKVNAAQEEHDDDNANLNDDEPDSDIEQEHQAQNDDDDEDDNTNYLANNGNFNQNEVMS